MREKRLHIEHGNLISREKLFAYIRNELSAGEKLRIEKLIQTDPFLSDAVDGLKNADLKTVNNSLDKIYRDIDILTGEKKPFTITRTVKMYAVAATMILFLGLTFVIMDRLNDQQQAGNIAMEPVVKNTETISADTSITSDMGGGSSTFDSVGEPAFNSVGNGEVRKNTNASEVKDIYAETETTTVGSTVAEDKTESDELAIVEVNKTAEQLYSTPGVLNDEISMTDMNLDTNVLEAPFTTSNVATTNESYGFLSGDTKDDYKVESEKTKKIAVFKERNEVAPASSERSDAVILKQEDLETGSGYIYTEPEIYPEFPGGADSLKIYLDKNVQYPFSDYKAEGKVYVQFIINEDGSVSDAVVKKGMGSAFDIEALRVVMEMPNWKPGTVDGKAVKVEYTLPIKFKSE